MKHVFVAGLATGDFLIWILDDIQIFIRICRYTDLYGFLIFEKTDFYHYHLATLKLGSGENSMSPDLCYFHRCSSRVSYFGLMSFSLSGLQLFQKL